MESTSAPRICSVDGCGAPLRASNTIGRCREHAYIPAAGAVCAADGCGRVLRKDNATGFCTPHKRAKSRGPVPKRDLSGRVYPDRTCPDCGDVFTPASATKQRCPGCRPERRRDLRRKQEWDVCSVDGCEAKLRTSNTTGRCYPHKFTVPRDTCAADGCGEPLRKDNGTGYCQAHRTAKAREPVRPCGAPGCDRTLRTDNTTGYCPDHVEPMWKDRDYLDRKYARERTERAQRPDDRRTCSVDGCDRKLRSDNTSGRCVDHIYIPLDLPVCSIDGCGNRLNSTNTLGRCTEHRGIYWAANAPKCAVPGCGKTLRADAAEGFCRLHRSLGRGTYNRDYYQRTQAERREYARQYREVYAEEHRAHASARRSAARSGLDVADRALSVAYRLAILGDPCFYCGSPETDHVDHFFPIAKGGTDHWWNLVRSCAKCNHAKYDKCGTAFLLLSGG